MWSFLYENGSGLMKSSEQSESKTANGFTFAVLAKAADGQYRHTLRGGFFQKCLKSSPRRGLYFSARTIQNPHKNDIARANVYPTYIVIRQITYYIIYLRALKCKSLVRLRPTDRRRANLRTLLLLNSKRVRALMVTKRIARRSSRAILLVHHQGLEPWTP